MSSAQIEPHDAAQQEELGGIAPRMDEAARKRFVREHHQRHVVLFVATGGTLMLVVALWVMILPTQIGSGRGIGIKSAASWIKTAPGEQADTPRSFGEVMSRLRQNLNDFESAQRARYAQEDAIKTETDRLRARIESLNGTNAPAANAPANANR